MNFQLFEGDSDAPCECTCINCPVHGRTQLKLSAGLSSVLETNENINAPDLNMNQFDTVLTSVTPLQENDIKGNTGKERHITVNDIKVTKSPDTKLLDDEESSDNESSDNESSNDGLRKNEESNKIVENFQESMRINALDIDTTSDSYGSDLLYDLDVSSPRSEEYTLTMQAFMNAKKKGNDPYQAMQRQKILRPKFYVGTLHGTK